jgi:hypothetical protein
LNVYHDRNKTGTLRKWRTIKDKDIWALEVLDGVNVFGTHAQGAPAGVNSISVEPVYRRVFSRESRGPLIIEINDTVIGISTHRPFVVVMKSDPDFLEDQ